MCPLAGRGLSRSARLHTPLSRREGKDWLRTSPEDSEVHLFPRCDTTCRLRVSDVHGACTPDARIRGGDSSYGSGGRSLLFSFRRERHQVQDVAWNSLLDVS